MDARDKILTSLLERIITKLGEPLSPEERECRWDEEAKQRYSKILRGYLQKIQAEEYRENQEKEINFTYGLAYEGIEKGELADLILEFDEKWNEKYAEKPAWWWKRKEGKLGKLEEPPRRNFK